MRVKATREGLVGGKTASGYTVDTVVPFVALPSKRALGRFVRLYNPANGNSCIAIVLDVGPWNTDDDRYVFHNERPLSESGKSVSGHGTNLAGIDLSEKVWKLLGMTDNSEIEWEFIG
jgi:hypothetical protein